MQCVLKPSYIKIDIKVKKIINEVIMASLFVKSS